jgi:hypothetical protein
MNRRGAAPREFDHELDHRGVTTASPPTPATPAELDATLTDLAALVRIVRQVDAGRERAMRAWLLPITTGSPCWP